MYTYIDKNQTVVILRDFNYLESEPQCMAYILARCPRRVRLVRICIRPTGSMLVVACAKLVSHAAFLAS